MTEINQKEYLKKYLGIGKAPGEKKRKKKRLKGVLDRVKIIDDDADSNSIVIEDDPFQANENEDAPQIVAIIDERPPSMRIDEKTKNHLWQPIGSFDEDSVDQKPDLKILVLGQSDDFRDISPPRKNLKDSGVSIKQEIEDDYSPERNEESSHRRLNESDHNSTVRARDDNFSPRRSRTNDSSPLRKSNREESSPPRRNRTDNASPPRKNQKDDTSPPRRNRKLESPPPKKSRTEDISPPRKNRRVDNSPPRRNKSTREGSPPLIKSKAADSSPRRKRSYDNSPIRKRTIKVEPQSPSSSKRSKDNTPPRKSRWSNNSPETSRKMEKTLDGKAAGLQDARQLVEETREFREREETLFKNLSKEVSGENAQTVHRNRKTGKIRNLDEEEARKRKKQEEVDKNKEKYARWGRGLAQVENREQKLQDELHEMSKPLARYADDEDLEKYLKDQEREGDPMLAYIRSKKRKQSAKEGKSEKPLFEGEFMPNRFAIRPGHRWDGVDRSNGYEKRWFEVQNARTAQVEETYKWSIEDM